MELNNLTEVEILRVQVAQLREALEYSCPYCFGSGKISELEEVPRG